MTAFPIARAHRAIVLWILALAVLGGCAVGGAERDERAFAVPDLERISSDLVYALSQAPGLMPLRTTVQMTEPTTEYGRRIALALAAAGYGIQDAPYDEGEHYVSYTSVRATGDDGSRQTFRLGLGDAVAERAYARIEGRTMPTSPMSIRGVRMPSKPITLDASLFPSLGSDIDRVTVERPEAPVVEELPVTAGRGPGGAEEPEPAPGAATGTGRLASNVLQNMYTRQGSNYAEAFVHYDDVMSEVLPFGDDSVRMGEANKATVRRVVEAMRPATDIVSVVGCSHGPTAIGAPGQGNALLAHGRSHRVKEELLFAGIDPEAVWDEACYAPTAFDKMPARGVVLTLKRRRS